MTAQLKLHEHHHDPLPGYNSILLALDASDHANQGLRDAVVLAGLWHAKVTGTHVYAAKLHDLRFRQMEGGLPEQFRDEPELERQRDVHDDLITRGLSIISDSYLDHAEGICQETGLTFARRALEGKNYRELVREANNGHYDLLIMGALGLGAVQNSRLGTVCQRTARRSAIDTLVIKEPDRSIGEGPIVVAVDGSTKAYGGLLTALALAQHWNTDVNVVAAFDPYYHYVAFNRIAGVLSEDAGKVFRFKEQEKLHEEIIDSGLAKIYQGHLDVATSIAEAHGMTVDTVLLDGKPHDAIARYLRQTKPSLLVVGKVGIHGDEDLDIGGVTEHLLHDADCAVLLSQRDYRPRIDVVADITTSWTREAEERMNNVPSFVRNMARMAILRYAQERGHTVITEKIVSEATAQLMPHHAEQAMTEIVAAHDAGELKRKPPIDDVMRWSEDATALLRTVDDLSLRGNLSMRAEKKARTDGAATVEAKHLATFIGAMSAPRPRSSTQTDRGADTAPSLHWQTTALARLMRVPEGFMRDASRQRIEDYARRQNITDISLAVAEAGLAEAREAMAQTMKAQGCAAADKPSGQCPVAHAAETKNEQNEPTIPWTPEAQTCLEKVPKGFMRDLTRQRVARFAERKGYDLITPQVVDEKYHEWSEGSARQQTTLPWDATALARIHRIPDVVRGMVILEVERCARDSGAETVTPKIMARAMERWAGANAFHSDTHPDLYQD